MPQNWATSFKKIWRIVQKIFNVLAPKERYLFGLFALILIGSLVAVGTQLYISKSRVVPAEGGEIKEALIGLPRFINPVLSAPNSVDRDLARLIYSSLVTYDKDGNIIGDLAAEYTVSEKGNEYTFVLKENLIWEDGEPLTAEDVLFTISIIQNADYGSPLFQAWESVEASAEGRTITLKLPTAYPPFIENATLGILPKHIWEGISPQRFTLTDFNLKPIGSGPFKVEKFSQNTSGLISSYTLSKNENYHGQKPYLNRITFKFYSDETEAIRAYNSNAVDSLSYVSAVNLEKLENQQSLNFYELKIPSIFGIFFNPNNADALKDQKVREALYAATNRDILIHDVLQGYATRADTPISPSLQKYYNKTVKQQPYDIERARKLLDEAGWADVNDSGIRQKITENDEGEEIVKELRFTLVTGSSTELQKIATTIKDQWREAGVLVEIQNQDPGELQQETIKNKNYEIMLFGQTLSTIPDPYPFWHSSQINGLGLNLAMYKNEDIDELLENARLEIDETKRIQSYMEFQEDVANDIPAIFLYDPDYIYPVNKVVKGVKPAFIVDSSFRFVDIVNWYIETKHTFK